MAAKQFLKSTSRQLGLYQATLLASRLTGILRDVLILLVVGAGALTDQIFFIFSFPDVFMSFLVGGGAVLFLSDCYHEGRAARNIKSIALSGALIYLLVATLVIFVEVFSGAPIGQILYADVHDNAELKTAYLISICALLFSLPMVVPNSIYLFKDKLFLQPVMNIVFTVVVIVSVLFLHYVDRLSINAAGTIVVVASLFRLLLAALASSKVCTNPHNQANIIRESSFYKGLILSGVSIGVLVLLPFVFRAKLPDFGEGLYASSAIYFKFNDLVLAFFVIPVTSLLLKNSDIRNRGIGKSLGAILFFSVLAAFAISLCIEIISLFDIDVPILSISPELAMYVASCLVFSAAAYMVSMVLVKRKQHKISAVAAGGALGYLLLVQRSELVDLQNYFYDLYICYLIYIVTVLYLIFCHKWVRSGILTKN